MDRWGTHTWWGAHIHGGEPTYMVAWLALVLGPGARAPGPALGPARARPPTNAG